MCIYSFNPQKNIIKYIYKSPITNNNNCEDVTSCSLQEGKLDQNKTSVFCVLFCLFCCHDLCQGLWNCIYKAVFVFITVLAGIFVSILKESGGGLVLSFALSQLGPWEYGDKKKDINKD